MTAADRLRVIMGLHQAHVQVYRFNAEPLLMGFDFGLYDRPLTPAYSLAPYSFRATTSTGLSDGPSHDLVRSH
jgi:hypothetical protein